MRRIILAALALITLALPARAVDADFTGNTGTITDVISSTPAVQASAYGDGDVIGGKQEITVFRAPNRSALLRSIVITSKADLTVNADVVLFSSDPSASTFTENGALSVAAADAPKVIGIFTVSARVDLGTPVVAQLQNQAIALIGNGTTKTIWAVIVVRGAYTPGSTSDVTLRLGIEQN